MGIYMRGCAIIVVLFFFITGCAGRAANPVAEYQYGDDNKSCNHIKAELAQINNDIVLKKQAHSNTTAANVGIFVVGLFIWPVWFAMDLKNADGVEAEAFQRRYNALVRQSVDKSCGLESQEIKIEKPKPEIKKDENI